MAPAAAHHEPSRSPRAKLRDVILTSMVALSTLTPDAQKLFEQRLAHVAERSLS